MQLNVKLMSIFNSIFAGIKSEKEESTKQRNFLHSYLRKKYLYICYKEKIIAFKQVSIFNFNRAWKKNKISTK